MMRFIITTINALAMAIIVFGGDTIIALDDALVASLGQQDGASSDA